MSFPSNGDGRVYLLGASLSFEKKKFGVVLCLCFWLVDFIAVAEKFVVVQ